MIENLIIKVIKENIKKGKYYTFDDKVISQNICIEDYFDNFGLEIRIHTDEDSLDNTIQIKHNGILIKEFNIDKNNLDIASLQEEYHEEKLSEVENAIIKNIISLKQKLLKWVLIKIPVFLLHIILMGQRNE